MPERQIYLLSPKDLSPETIAVAFAKTSRSPESFREIADGLSDEGSAKFHEKWVVGYGHASVAEHAILHIAIENVSRMAMEAIESNRLASYTEKSTRYQKWGPDDFTVPPELDGHPLRDEFVDTDPLSLLDLRRLARPRAGDCLEARCAQGRRIRRGLGSPRPLAICGLVPLPPARRRARQRGHDRQRACAGERRPQVPVASAGRSPRNWGEGKGNGKG